ncbi:hypothetical protein EU527_16130 [Candidatus Thorarchaeota archaeon]|nr:MAG: hypothetical protein EU527_16130 [Candidatus Thorarchaeota archaeon]
MKKAVALSHFIGQLILGILQIVAVFGYVMLFQELFGSIFTGSTYVDMVYLSTLAFLVIHGLWRIIDNFVAWRNAD